MDLDGLKWDGAGLVTVVVQDRHTGEVRMVGHADREAVQRTLATGDGWLFSRSRRALWRKGESSGNTLRVHEVWADCDGDALVYRVDPTGPTCHTGARSCFSWRLVPAGDTSSTPEGSGPGAAPTLSRLWDELVARRSATAERSYTRALLDSGPPTVAGKVREEADELGEALTAESEGRVISETADLLYHALVGLLSRGVTLREVIAELSARMGVSGHEEKASRSR